MLNVDKIKTYYDKAYVIREVSFALTKGKISVLLGSNGAGKTTILKTIMGLIDEQPSSGTIRFFDQGIDGLDVEDIVRLGITYVPEERALFDEFSVHENLLMGTYIRKDSKKIIKDDIELIYQYFPLLKERKKVLTGDLSGGEQQMLAIGRALLMRPKLLLLDEPSLGLSNSLIDEIFKILRLVSQNGMTILLVEQNIKKALEISDYGYILENGRIVLHGDSKELLNNQNVKNLYLGYLPDDLRLYGQ